MNWGRSLQPRVDVAPALACSGLGQSSVRSLLEAEPELGILIPLPPEGGRAVRRAVRSSRDMGLAGTASAWHPRAPEHQ